MLNLNCMKNKVVTLTVPPRPRATVIKIVPHRNQHSGRYVRIGFEAPREVEIVRSDAIAQERQPVRANKQDLQEFLRGQAKREQIRAAVTESLENNMDRALELAGVVDSVVHDPLLIPSLSQRDLRAMAMLAYVGLTTLAEPIVAKELVGG